MPNTRTTIAIVGGGIGGLSAAISLRRLPNVDVQIFEKAQALKEIGASIALGPNGLRGLEEMGAVNALHNEIAFRSDHGYPMVYKHWKTSQVLVKDEHSPSVTEWRHHTARYFRPHLQQALIDNIPPDTIHLRKRLIDVKVRSDQEEDAVLLRFEDGSQYTADLVIGADGIKSTVRSVFLPDFHLERTGQIALRAVFDSALIEDLITENPELKNSVHVTGLDRNFFSSLLGKGKFTVVGLGYEDEESSPWKGKKWDDKADIEQFREAYKDWNPWIPAILDRVPPDSLHVYPAKASNQVPYPVHEGRVALLGDAFHSHGGALAAGGSLAIDDSIALFLSIQHVQRTHISEGKLSAMDLRHALDLYARTRLPHVNTVCNVVERLRGNAAKSGKHWDEEQISMWSKNKKDVVWLHEHDVHEAFAQVC